jgi:hypothetical protein
MFAHIPTFENITKKKDEIYFSKMNLGMLLKSPNEFRPHMPEFLSASLDATNAEGIATANFLTKISQSYHFGESLLHDNYKPCVLTFELDDIRTCFNINENGIIIKHNSKLGDNFIVQQIHGDNTQRRIPILKNMPTITDLYSSDLTKQYEILIETYEDLLISNNITKSPVNLDYFEDKDIFQGLSDIHDIYYKKGKDTKQGSWIAISKSLSSANYKIRKLVEYEPIDRN